MRIVLDDKCKARNPAFVLNPYGVLNHVVSHDPPVAAARQPGAIDIEALRAS